MWIPPVLADPIIIAAIIGAAGAVAGGTISAVAGPDAPKVPDESKEIAEARRKRMEEMRRRQGRGASLLSGGGGLVSQPTLGRTSLLGGGAQPTA
jgi:hypothetical protein